MKCALEAREDSTMIASLLFGAAVGFSLGLTGGGGAIFAVPLLVYGLGLPAREAVGVSLMTVGTTALVGFAERTRRGLVEFPTGLIFAASGMIGAPIGTWIGGSTPETLLLTLFAMLMLVIAARMWFRASAPRAVSTNACAPADAGPTCRRDTAGKLRLTSRCAALLAVVGLLAGVMAGLFGVGGGFVIVPALVTFAGMGIQRAIGTSLLVIALVSASGTAGYLAAGETMSFSMAARFIIGAILGLAAGTALAGRLAGPTLQKVFAAAIVGVAALVLVRTLW
jgi:uncharacterized membrane protein YfcA